MDLYEVDPEKDNSEKNNSSFKIFSPLDCTWLTPPDTPEDMNIKNQYEPTFQIDTSDMRPNENTKNKFSKINNGNHTNVWNRRDPFTKKGMKNKPKEVRKEFIEVHRDIPENNLVFPNSPKNVKNNHTNDLTKDKPSITRGNTDSNNNQNLISESNFQNLLTRLRPQNNNSKPLPQPIIPQSIDVRQSETHRDDNIELPDYPDLDDEGDVVDEKSDKIERKNRMKEVMRIKRRYHEWLKTITEEEYSLDDLYHDFIHFFQTDMNKKSFAQMFDTRLNFQTKRIRRNTILKMYYRKKL